MTLPRRARTTRFLSLLLAIGSVACGDDGPTGPPGSGTAVSIEVEPRSLLLTPGGDPHPLTVYAVDAAGTRTEIDASFETSNGAAVSVNGDGTVSPGALVGSATVTARADGLTSSPVMVLVARPAAGALLVADSQVMSAPQALDPNAPNGAGWRYTVGISGAAPQVGQIMLASESAPIAGRVVSVAQGSGGVMVTLEVRPLPELFDELSVDLTLPLGPAVPLAAPSGNTPSPGAMPGVRGASSLRPGSDFNGAGASVGQPDVEFRVGVFECKASGEITASDFSLDAGPLTVTPNVSLQVVADAIGGLQRLAVVGTLETKQELKPRVTGSVSGEVDCHATPFTIPFPASGALSFVITGSLPIGAGFTVKVEASSASVGADLDLRAQSQATIGVDCLGGCHIVTDLTIDADSSKLKAVLPEIGLSARIKLAGSAYLYAEFAIGNPILETIRLDLIEAKLGLRQEFDLASREFQAADVTYASSFHLKPFISAATTASIGEAAGTLGFELEPRTFEPELPELGRSPVGTLTIAPATVRAGSDTEVGEQATFTVTMDTVNFLGAYSIETIEIRWKRNIVGGGFTLEPARPGCTDLAAAQGQTVFTCTTDFPAEEIGTHTFYAFAKTRIFGIPVIVPLEVAANAAATLAVTGAPPAGIRLESIMELQGPGVEAGVGTLSCSKGWDVLEVPPAASLTYSKNDSCAATGSDVNGTPSSAQIAAQHSYLVTTSNGAIAGDLHSIQFGATITGSVSDGDPLFGAQGQAGSRGTIRMCFTVPAGVSAGYQLRATYTGGDQGTAIVDLDGSGDFLELRETLDGANGASQEFTHSGRFVQGSTCLEYIATLNLETDDNTRTLSQTATSSVLLTITP